MQLAARGCGGTRNSSGDGKAPSAGTRPFEPFALRLEPKDTRYQALPGLVSTSSPEKDQGRRKRAGADLWPDSAGPGLAAGASVPKRHRSSNPSSLVRACSEANRAPRDGGVPQQQRLGAELAQARDDVKRLQVATFLEHLALHSWLLCSLNETCTLPLAHGTQFGAAQHRCALGAGRGRKTAHGERAAWPGCCSWKAGNTNMWCCGRCSFFEAGTSGQQ